MSIKALQEYTRFSKYALYNEDLKRRELWDEQITRVFDMHREKYKEELSLLKDDIDFAEKMVKQKRVLGSQRALQFGGKPVLAKHSRIYNCLHKETDFITKNGVKRFSEFNDGDETIVLSHNGTWENAIVKNYGNSSFNKITFSKGSSRDFVVYATPNHRWILKDGKETTKIKEGDQLFRQPNVFNSWNYDDADPMEKLYWSYGLVAGDGTLIHDSKTGASHSMIRLCGHDKQYKNRFEELGFKTSSSLSIGGDFYAYTGTYLKTLPNPYIDDINLLRAFCRGLLDADGEKNKAYKKNDTGSMYLTIQQTSKEIQNFIRKVFPIVGIYIISETKCTRKTNFGIHDAVLFRLSTSCEGSSAVWKVKEIEDDVFMDDAWCLEVENEHSFVMPNGITTGNCTASYCDRPSFFQECMHLLLCGCGTGFSVQRHHVARLPEIKTPYKGIKVFQPTDDIEGWSDCIGVLMSSYFDSDLVPFPEYRGYEVEFDLSKIRPEGSKISSGSKAPGPEPLRESLVRISELMKRVLKHQNRLKPINAYDIVMFASDAVLSGGIRRSATICLFSDDDEEMINAKIGNWREDNKQRGRSNNSALIIRDEITKKAFSEIIGRTKQYGEPGFVLSENSELVVNPCVEVGMFPKLPITDEIREKFPQEIAIMEEGKRNFNSYPFRAEGKEWVWKDEWDNYLSGWQNCNLCEVNMKKAKTEEDFLLACKAAAIIGTLQAGYTRFEYMGNVTELICEGEALLGVSMTGMADNPDIAFNPEIQRKGAKEVLDTNKRIAEIIKINPSARTTCVKPAGSSSCVLGTASGIHPHHAKRYFRRVQANKLESPLHYFKQFNPLAVEQSVWKESDEIIIFLCEVPDGAKIKNQTDAISLLEMVKLTQQNWVEYGTRKDRCVFPWLRHNVSNTINIKPDEWEDVTDYIYKNKKWFAGISMLSVSGDKDYPQAPFTAIYTPSEIVREYGDGSIMASGLIVDGLRVFNNNLWGACDCVLNIGEILDVETLRKKISNDFITNGENWKKEGLSPSSPDRLLLAWLKESVENYELKKEWVRRALQFSSRYFGGDTRKMTYCLKDVANWKTWCDLSREYKDVDWSQCIEDKVDIDFNKDGGACSGGACELGDLGITIDESKRRVA